MRSEEVEITITYSTIVTEVKKQLSVLGKRARDKQGNSQFAEVTVSSAEHAAFTDYIEQGISNVLSDMPRFITLETATSTSTTLKVKNTRWKNVDADSFKESFVSSFSSYVTSFALYEYLSMTQSQLAQKFQADCAVRLKSLHELLYHKGEPDESAKGYKDVKGNV